MLQKVQEYVKNQVSDIGINVEKVYLVGSMRLPTAVTTALNLKIEATQKAQQRKNELRTTEAEAKKLLSRLKAKLLQPYAEPKHKHRQTNSCQHRLLLSLYDMKL